MKKILLILIICSCSLVFSQQEKKIVLPDLSKDLIVFIDSLDLIQSREEYFSLDEFNNWWNTLYEKENGDTFVKSLEYRTKDIKSLTGLRLQAHYNKNFEAAIDDDEDLSYSSRVYVGLEWEFLRHGLLSSRKKARKFSIENEIKKIKYKRELLRYSQISGHTEIDEAFNRRIRLLLIKKLRIEEKLYDIYRFLSFEKSYSKIDVLEKLEKIYLIKNNLENIVVSDSVGISLKQFPFFKLNIAAVNKYNRNNALDSLLLTHKINALNAYSYIYDNWSLRPNIRYHYYNRVDNSTKTFASAGVSLSIPLATGRNKRKYVEYSVQDLKERESFKELNRDRVIKELKDNYRSYQARLLMKLRDKKVQEVRMNSMRNRMHISPSTISGVEFLNVLSDDIAIEMSILEINKILYNNFLQISTLLDGVHPHDFCDKVDEHPRYERTVSPRYIYIWSSFIKSMPSLKLVAHLEEADIKNVLISFNKIPKSNKYIKSLLDNNINVDLLIGNNKLLDKNENYIRAYIRDKLKQNVSGIHLDIEPHAVQSWKYRKEDYYKKLLEIYLISRQECNKVNKYLGVSIPVFYSDAFLKKANILCDKIFVMAYGSSNPNVIMKNIKQELDIIDSGKLVIALNNPDFKSATEREIIINELIKYSACENIAYHKASNFFYINNIK